MNIKRKTLIILSFWVAFYGHAFASREAIVAIRSLKYSSESKLYGKMYVEIEQDENGVIGNMYVNAFGRKYVIPNDQLLKLGGHLWNGIRVCYQRYEDDSVDIIIVLEKGASAELSDCAEVTVKRGGGSDVKVRKMK